MEIKLKSVSNERYPLCGFFIEGPDLESWLTILNDMGLNPSALELYALPSSVPNVIWGCLVLTNVNNLPETLGRFIGAHHISNKLIIPERTAIGPTLTTYDFEHLLGADRYVFHMDFGLFKLEEPISLSGHILVEDFSTAHTTKPIPYTAVDPLVNSFRIEATPIEELKAEMEARPKREKLENKPLNFREKARLKLYEQFLKVEEGEDGKAVLEKTTESALDKLAKFLGLDGPDVKDNLMNDFEQLSDRNKKEVDKLMDLLEKNPEDALRYAIPLDEHGYSRGERSADFKMQDRGLDFSLFGKLTGGGGGTVDLGDEYFRLQQQYRRSAEALEEKGDYEKAAFVYLKLLKEYFNAAETLRRGRMYEKAAYVYTKYLNNEIKAAECYEQGLIYDKAIALYKKHNNLEKVGDLYAIQGKQQLANTTYQQVVDGFLNQSKYLKASLLCRNKLMDMNQTQEILLNGWKNRSDARSCLSMYFSNITDADEAWEQVNFIQRHHLNPQNDVAFLHVIKQEFKARSSHTEKLRDLGYSMISKLLERGAISSDELLAFSKKDKRLVADTMRYTINKNKRMK